MREGVLTGYNQSTRSLKVSFSSPPLPFAFAELSDPFSGIKRPGAEQRAVPQNMMCGGAVALSPLSVGGKETDAKKHGKRRERRGEILSGGTVEVGGPFVVSMNEWWGR